METEMKKIVKLIVKEPYMEPEIREVEDTLENMQEIVGGDIDCVEMPTIENVDIFFDDEGMLKGKMGNFWLPEYEDCIKGTCYLVGYDPETGDSVSLSDKQIMKCFQYIDKWKLPQNKDLYMDFQELDNLMRTKYLKEKKLQEEM